MPDELTADQISLLCEVGEFDLSTLRPDRKNDLEWLRSEGWIEPAHGHPASSFQLTRKGLDFLSKRGAGLNEA
jgi:hypothetical protein